MPTRRRCPPLSHVPCPVCHPPIGANWWLLVLGWDNWSTWSINVYKHIYMASQARCPPCPVPSCPILSHPILYGPIGGCWWWAGTIGPHGPSMYTSIYIWHLRQDVPLVPSCPVLSRLVLSCMGQLVAVAAGLGQLVHMVHQCIQAYIYIYGISGKMSPLSRPVPSCPVPSRPVPSRPILYGPIGGCWCWAGTIGPHGPSMYTSMYMASQARCSPCRVPSCPVLSCPILSHPILSHPILYGPIGGYWCWAGTIGPQGPSMYTSIYMASEARCPPCPIPSHPVPSHPAPSCPILYGPIGGYWCWAVTIGPYGPSMYTSIYMASQARCPTCHVPSCPILSCPILSCPVLSCPIPSRPILYGPIGGYYCWAGTIGPQGPSMYTSIYMTSEARCPPCPIPSHPIPSHPVPSCPILYGPIGGYWCWAVTIGPHGPSMYTSIYMASQARCPLVVHIILLSLKANRSPIPKRILVMHHHKVQHVCPVHLVENYAQKRAQLMVKAKQTSEAPFFIHQNLASLTRQQVIVMLKKTLRMNGMYKSRYGTHSFRVGRATDLYRLGSSDEQKRHAGRWRSNAMWHYIRPT